MGHRGATATIGPRPGRLQGPGQDARSRRARRSRSDHALEEAGAFAIVLEAIPPDLALEITESVSIPTIGIGAGAGCDGQVLVCYDMLGMSPDFKPKFAKRFAEIGSQNRTRNRELRQRGPRA